MPVGESGSARGDVISVTVSARDPRPYLIALVGHRFAYEVALDDSDRPAISDLRLAALGAGEPITKADLYTAANVLDRLALIAAKRRDAVEIDRQMEQGLRAGLEAALGDELDKRGIDLGDIKVTSWTAPGPVVIPAAKRKRGRGRPSRPLEFYKRVALAADQAEADPDMRSTAKGVQLRAADWPDVEGTPPLSTVERWIKQARKYGFYQGPRADQTEGENR
jgi:hypothetical protein